MAGTRKPAGEGADREPGDARVHLVQGDDAALIAQATRTLLAGLVAERDPSLVVEEHGAGGEEVEVGRVVDAVTTPPFLVDRRVVVVREAGRLRAEDGARLAAALADAPAGVVLVLAGGGGTVPAVLVKAAAGGVVDTRVGTGRARSDWFAAALRDAPVRLDPAARARIEEHLAADAARLPTILATLHGAYGDGAAVGLEQLAPFLGEPGAVPPWELTDAVDAGEVPRALDALARMTAGGAVHGLVVLATLHRHFQTMLRLDGAAVGSAEEAAALIGARSVYPVKKAMEQGRRLGSARIGRALVLLADADLDLRGRSALSDRTVLEILVARLGRLGGVQGAGTRRRARAGR